MPTLTAAQIASIVKRGNMSSYVNNQDTDGPIFVAIALAESGGVTDIVSPTGDYGVWQINKKAHASLFNNRDWKNPNDNFAMAIALYQGRGFKFTDWTTYKTKAYVPFLPAAQHAWNNPDDSATAANPVQQAQNAGSDAADAVGSTAAFLAAIQKPETWIRVGMGVAGVILLLVAIVPMMKTHIPGPLGMAVRATSKATKVAPAAGEAA